MKTKKKGPYILAVTEEDAATGAASASLIGTVMSCSRCGKRSKIGSVVIVGDLQVAFCRTAVCELAGQRTAEWALENRQGFLKSKIKQRLKG